MRASKGIFKSVQGRNVPNKGGLNMPETQLLTPEYIPDQDLYPGQSFHSFSEMKEACPKLYEKQELMEKESKPYTPYVCRYESD